MAKATDVLREEHKAILKMLDAAEEAARRIQSDTAVSSALLLDFLEFFRRK